MKRAAGVRIGVAGLGHVGGSAVRLLREGAEEFERRLGAPLRVEAVCDRQAAREARRLGLRGVRLYTDPLKLAADPGLDVVVETIGGLRDARALVLKSLASGKHVVTANKRLLAHHWEEVFGAAARARRRVYFEASVAGGIPILQAIHHSLAGNRIRRVLGILNGTTNFILTRMTHDGATLEAALAEAQRLGLAERDPSMDLEGADAAHKVAVVASLLTGSWVRPGTVRYSGILDVRPEDLRFAVGSLQRTVRLLGTVDVDWDAAPPRVRAGVQPTLVPLDHPLAAVHGEYNAVLVQASAAGDLMFYGRGAGPGPAASAVVGDLFMLAQEILGGRSASTPVTPWAPGRVVRLAPAAEDRSGHYLRLSVLDRPGALARITGLLGRRGISIAQIHQDRPAAGGNGARATVFLTTHPAAQRDMERALASILALPEVGRPHAWFRVL